MITGALEKLPSFAECLIILQQFMLSDMRTSEKETVLFPFGWTMSNVVVMSRALPLADTEGGTIMIVVIMKTLELSA